VNAFKYVIASLAFLLPTSSYAASFYAYTFSGTGFGKQQTFDYASGTGQSFYVSGDFSTTFIVDLEANDGSAGPYIGNGKSSFYSFGNKLPSDNGPYMTGVSLGGNTLSAYLMSPEFYNVGTNVSVNFTETVNQFSDILNSTGFSGGDFSYTNLRYDSSVNVAGKITGFSVQAVSKFEQNAPLFSNVVTSPVPEVSSWLMMLTGFGLIGSVARLRKSTMKTVRFA